MAEEKHPCVILFYEDVNNKNFYIVAWGTTSPPSEGESRLRIPVKAGADEAVACGLPQDTFFYSDHIVCTTERKLTKTSHRCPNGLYKRIRDNIEDRLKKIYFPDK